MSKVISEDSQSLPLWGVLIIVLTVVVQPFGVSYELFTLMMALLGSHDLIRNHHGCRQSPTVQFYTLLFACLWLPGIVALPDAVNFKASLVDTLGLLRFYFAGVFITNRLVSIETIKTVSIAITAIVFFWCADAWLQNVLGYNFLGMQQVNVRYVSGIFGDDPVLGWMLVLYAGISLLLLITKVLCWL